MPNKQIAVAIIAAMALIAPAQATQTALQLTITTQSGEFEQRAMRYDCGAEPPFRLSISMPHPTSWPSSRQQKNQSLDLCRRYRGLRRPLCRR
ncbi:MAG: hypothetical protein MO852_08305 [Candidatus Devosia euplotis]|nr:hypothetical protein [Candidatus Devosia euplotis]